MIDLLEMHKFFILKHLRPGDTAVDFTMGNGYDTVFLSKAVGESGRVFAFDIQAQALQSTSQRLVDEGCPNNYTLIEDSHHRVKQYVEGPIKAGMFNLGWLPGGDHSVTTRWETTREAVTKALDLLLPGGVLVLCAYPGHTEGDRERNELVPFLSSLSNKTFNVLRQSFLNAGPGAPECFVVQKME